MTDMYCSHFEYGGVNSRKYNLIIANIDTERFKQLSGTIEGNTIFSNSGKRNYLIGDDYTESPLSFEIEIVTDDYRGLPLPVIRDVQKWLFNKHEYRKMYFDMADDYFAEFYELVDGVPKRSYFNCRLINPEKIEFNGGTIGFKCTLECDSNMLWQDAITKSIEIAGASESSVNTFSLEIDTDIDAYTYPKVTVHMGTSGGDFTLINNTDDETRQTKFVGIGASASVITKGEINFVTSGYYEKFSGRNFVRLLDGENNFTIRGNVASIDFEWQNRRML